MAHPVVLDLETKHTFREFSEHAKLGISVAALYDYADEMMYSYFESDLAGLCARLERASVIIGYNIVNFDLPVLQAYYPGTISQFATLDILDDIKEKLGHRLALNDVANATLGLSKSGHGLQAIELYRENKLEELRRYCQDDVDLTKKLFDFGVENGEIFYMNHTGKSSIRVNWKQRLTDAHTKDISLTLPF